MIFIILLHVHTLYVCTSIGQFMGPPVSINIFLSLAISSAVTADRSQFVLGDLCCTLVSGGGLLEERVVPVAMAIEFSDPVAVAMELSSGGLS